MKDILFNPGCSAVAIHRLSHICRKKDWIIGRIISNILFRINSIINNIDIHPEAIIGRNFYIPHSVGIVIGQCIIGSNVTILQNVSIGRTLSGDNDGYPDIGNNVTIYAGAVVVGKIKIGDGVRIGANSFVIRDVPDNCLAVGSPARIIYPEKN